MLYQALLWPEQFNMIPWPFTLEHTAYLWDRLPNGRMGIAPIGIYIATKLDLSCLKSEHT